MSKLSRILGYALLIAVLPLVLQAQMGQGRGNGQGVHRVARPVCFGLRPAEWPTSLIVALGILVSP